MFYRARPRRSSRSGRHHRPALLVRLLGRLAIVLALAWTLALRGM